MYNAWLLASKITLGNTFSALGNTFASTASTQSRIAQPPTATSHLSDDGHRPSFCVLSGFFAVAFSRNAGRRRHCFGHVDASGGFPCVRRFSLAQPTGRAAPTPATTTVAPLRLLASACLSSSWACGVVTHVPPRRHLIGLDRPHGSVPFCFVHHQTNLAPDRNPTSVGIDFDPYLIRVVDMGGGMSE